MTTHSVYGRFHGWENQNTKIVTTTTTATMSAQNSTLILIIFSASMVMRVQAEAGLLLQATTVPFASGICGGAMSVRSERSYKERLVVLASELVC